MSSDILHPESRKARRANRDKIREKRLQNQKRNVKKKHNGVRKLQEIDFPVDKFLWFQQRVLNGKDVYSLKDVSDLIEQ